MKRCLNCGQEHEWLDTELRDSFCPGSKYGTHKWRDVGARAPMSPPGAR